MKKTLLLITIACTLRTSDSATDNQWAYYNGGYGTATATTATKISTEGFNVDQAVTGVTANNSYLVSGVWIADAEL